ncbi:hypothetical protein BJ944DRAFT_269957 [Cunninghamella echinulata]|nr:hypothetical protein BJ944DRAFT_269957 [Cunninghamella echinulata]
MVVVLVVLQEIELGSLLLLLFSSFIECKDNVVELGLSVIMIGLVLLLLFKGDEVVEVDSFVLFHGWNSYLFPPSSSHFVSSLFFK